MHKNLRTILFSFTRQEHSSDCGAACLKTIFKYGGLKTSLPDSVTGKPLSLLDIQQLAASAGLEARAVRMDLDHLRELKTPCILHVLTDTVETHFIVCFGYDAALAMYLVADPDRQIGYWSERELSAKWQSRGAVHFGNVQPNSGWRISLYPWPYVLRFNFVPGLLWFAVPLLNLFGSAAGLGATLVIEKAVRPQFLNGDIAFMTAVFALLSCLSLAKCAVSYFKERLIIKFSGRLDLFLYQELVRPLDRLFPDRNYIMKRFSEGVRDTQRIHQAVAILVGGIMSDGLMVGVLLISLYLYFPVLVVLEVVVIITLFLLTNRQLPFMLANCWSGAGISSIWLHPEAAGGGNEADGLLSASIEENAALSRKSFWLSTNANKLNLCFELITSVNLILVLAYTILQMRRSFASYQEFLFGIILCYALTAMSTKICNQLFLVAQGAEMLGRCDHVC